MIIESVKKINDKKDSFAVLFDNGAELRVSPAQIADFAIYSGRVLSEEEYEELQESLSLNSAKARAMRILGSRMLSAREIEKRLRSKGESAETAQMTVKWLEETGLINDEDHANSIVSYYAGKGYGKARIRNELFKRGIDRELWEDAMSCLDDSGDAAFKFISKKLAGRRDKDDLRRAADTLCRRGFSYDEARAAINRYLEQLGDKE